VKCYLILLKVARFLGDNNDNCIGSGVGFPAAADDGNGGGGDDDDDDAAFEVFRIPIANICVSIIISILNYSTILIWLDLEVKLVSSKNIPSTPPHLLSTTINIPKRDLTC